MRIGIHPPFKAKDGTYLDAEAVARRAKMIEDAGLDGIWGGEHLPLPGDLARDMPDMLTHLAAAAVTTKSVELGTCIYCLPLHNKFAAAQRFSSLQAFAPGRVTLGVGTSSQKKEYDAVGLDWDKRFKILRDHVDAINAVFTGGWNGAPEVFDESTFASAKWNSDPAPSPSSNAENVAQRMTMAMAVGRPRIVLGAWASEIQLKRASTSYDGWMTSAGPGTALGGWRKVLSNGLARYRELGGKRAIVSTIQVDLRMPDIPLDDDGSFRLTCSPKTASDRLKLLEDLGYDDVILIPRDYQGNPNPRNILDFSEEDLDQYRALLPRDSRDFREA